MGNATNLSFTLPLQFLTENTEFKVVGIIGPPGVGKSTIMNEIYGYDGSSPGEISVMTPFQFDCSALFTSRFK